MNNLFFFLEDKPDDFKEGTEVSGVFIEAEGKILLLHRHPEKPHGNTWGLPAGKMEKGETPFETALREVKEETGISLSPDKVEKVGSRHVRVGDFDFIFHFYYAPLSSMPHLAHDEAHIDCRFFTLEEAKTLPLIAGRTDVIHLFEDFLSKRS